MGLRCLLGHDFDEPELRREREEDGSEVVTTVTEVKTCARCGKTLTVSENTEVTTMEQLAGEAAERGESAAASDASRETSTAGGRETSTTERTGETADPTAGREATEPGGPGESDRPTADGSVAADATSADDDGAVIIDGESASGDAGGPVDETEPSAGDAPAKTTGGEEPAEEDTASDDGVILDAGDESGDGRERGTWPAVEADEEPADGEAGADDGDAVSPWPEHRDDDEGFSASVGGAEADDVEFGGLTPEAGDGEPDEGDGTETEYVGPPDDAEAVTFDAGGDEAATRITRGASPELDAADGDEETEYYCPECEMVRAAAGNSMRAGDICPECKRGYVDERPR